MSTFHLPGPSQIQDVRYSIAQVEAAKAKVQQLWARGKEYRLQTGEALLALRQILSKKGHGTFRDTVTAMGIPKSTAHDYIRLYQESQGFVAAKEPRMSGTRTYSDVHRLIDAVHEFLRRRPEDIERFRKWVLANYPKP